MRAASPLRIAVSVLLFACILIAWSLGWIHPTGIPARALSRLREERPRRYRRLSGQSQ